MAGDAFEGRVAELTELARTEMADALVPGAQLGFIEGSSEQTCALGIADVRSGRLVDERTMFRTASITKTFTATLLVQLASAGRLGLDDPVRRYVPEFTLADRAAAERVTIRHLLLHTAGWDPHLEHVPDGPDSLALGAATQRRAAQIAPPGAYFSYNGVDYMVAGRVIEVITGRPYEEAIATNLLGPLGMTRTRFESEADDNVAGDHTVRDGRATILDDSRGARWGLPTGGLRSTAADLLRWARCHFGETRVLTPEVAARMAKPEVTLSSPAESKALCWFVREMGRERLLLHTGGAAGQQSLLALCPARRLAVAVVTNSATGSPMTTRILECALDLFLGLRAPGRPTAIAMDEGPLAEYEGRYMHLGADIVLVRDGGRLVLTLDQKGPYAARPTVPPAHLEFWDRDRVVGADGFASGQYGDFLRDERGHVAYFRWTGRARPRAESRSSDS